MEIKSEKLAVWIATMALGWAAFACAPAQAAMPSKCQKVVIPGEVSAGHEWRTGIGEGWVFRVIPIESGKAAYSGWDLVVDREQGVGYPDALLLATPPYGSINEREIGTTFGVRAQDAFGWNPRSFRFLTSPTDLASARELFRRVSAAPGDTDEAHKLMRLTQRSAQGQFRILDARLIPGVADAAPFAQAWAAQAARTPHEQDPAPASGATPRGELEWMRFAVTLWLPAAWKAPPSLRWTTGACAE